MTSERIRAAVWATAQAVRRLLVWSGWRRVPDIICVKEHDGVIIAIDFATGESIYADMRDRAWRPFAYSRPKRGPKKGEVVPIYSSKYTPSSSNPTSSTSSELTAYQSAKPESALSQRLMETDSGSVDAIAKTAPSENVNGAKVADFESATRRASMRASGDLSPGLERTKNCATEEALRMIQALSFIEEPPGPSK